jgi:hypothetical protein
MLWKMLQELGYEKQPKYYRTQLTYEVSKPVWHVQVYIFTPSPSEEFLKLRRSMPPSLQDVPSMLEFMMLPIKLTRSLVRAIAKSWMERSMHIFPQQASGSTYIHVEHVPDSRNFKLNKQVQLTTMLTNVLDSTMEGMEFWQEKYEEAMKTIWKLKCYYPQDVQTLSEEEMEEFTLTSPSRMLVTRAPPVYVIPNNDDD